MLLALGWAVASLGMPQLQLPIFPTSSCAITPELAFLQRDGSVVYFNGHLPVFSHAPDDIASFRFFTSQLIANGLASQSQISRAFGVPLITVKRACKTFRDFGAKGFFAPRPAREGHRLTAALLLEAQALLDAGISRAEVGERIGVLSDTLRKALADGRLKKKIPLPLAGR